MYSIIIKKRLVKAQRHQYWTFDVGRSMFDVQSILCPTRRSFIRGVRKNTERPQNYLNLKHKLEIRRAFDGYTGSI
jgi:hypothetical protein